jgi:rhodanese-related sulfurtransferase
MDVVGVEVRAGDERRRLAHGWNEWRVAVAFSDVERREFGGLRHSVCSAWLFLLSPIGAPLALASLSGRWLLIDCVTLFIAYLAMKCARRAQFVDLRLPQYFAAAPLTLPGAIRIPPAEMARRHGEIPRDREIVLYCSCSDERTSTRAALLLKQYGIHRVRPLAGGCETWMQKNFPMTSVAVLPRMPSLLPS